MPMGWRAAPVTAQRITELICSPISSDTVVWLDNINIMGDTPTAVTHKVSIVRERCRQVNAEINEAKSN